MNKTFLNIWLIIGVLMLVASSAFAQENADDSAIAENTIILDEEIPEKSTATLANIHNQNLSNTNNKLQPSGTQQSIVGSNLVKRSEMFNSAIKGLMYCFGVLLIGFAIKYKLKTKNEAPAGDNPIHILAKKSLGYRNNLLLIEVENKKFLVANNTDHSNLIAEIIDDSYLTKSDEAI